MQENIYRKMIEDSPMAYLHIKRLKDSNDSYVGIEIKDINKSYERLFNVKKSEIVNSKTKYISTNKEIEDWKDLFDSANKHEKYTTIKYIKRVNEYLNVEIYSEQNDEFYLRFSKIGHESMKLSSILKKSPFCVWIKDRDGIYVDVNNKYLEMFNLSYDEVIGKSDYDLWPKEIADKFLKQDKEVLINNTLYKYEDVNKLNNKTIYFETAKWPYTDVESKILLGTIGVASEITNIVKLRKNIEKNEQTFLEIANNVEELIIIRDDKKALYVSPSFEKIYGISPQKIGIYEDMNNWYKYWDSVIFEKEPKTYEYKKTDINTFKISKKGQEDIWMWSKFVPILDENENITKKIGILSNISKSKKLEEEIDSLRMDFFANLSHELRTPINLILSSIQVLNLKINNIDSENEQFFKKYLGIINQNGLRLLKLVNNLIDTTKLDSGHFDYTPQNNDIISCVENICMSVCEFIENNNMSIIFDTDLEEKIIAFDQDNIERIILNLISNAIKFNKPNGTIQVNINCEDNIKISVKDSGIGIPQDKLESIFGRFEQVKSKFKKEREGSGIGLSLVKSLVKKHNGSITVKSEVEKGTEFTITLPDILVKEDNEVEFVKSQYQNNINKMKVEFSDIYI